MYAVYVPRVQNCAQIVEIPTFQEHVEEQEVPEVRCWPFAAACRILASKMMVNVLC